MEMRPRLRVVASALDTALHGPALGLGRRGGRGPVPRGSGLCCGEAGEVGRRGESQLGEVDSAC